MAKLRTLKPQVQHRTASGKTIEKARANIKRTLVGNRLQRERLALWTEHPHCAHCGRLVEYPHGFELDHVVPNAQGGTDDRSNLQILCVDEFDKDKGCHAVKTKRDNALMSGRK
jgi:hypothetical protein